MSTFQEAECMDLSFEQKTKTVVSSSIYNVIHKDFKMLELPNVDIDNNNNFSLKCQMLFLKHFHTFLAKFLKILGLFLF